MSVTAAIIQARMGSTRLPGKSVMDIAGKPLIWHVVKRVSRAKLLDGVVIAIPEEKESPDILAATQELKIPVLIMPGDPNDLLARYNSAASMFGISTIVRIPADNPCVDPDEIDRIINVYRMGMYNSSGGTGQWLTSNLDRNLLANGYPGGLGAEVYDAWFMHWLGTNVEDIELREHPHKWAMEKGRVRTVECPPQFRRPELRFDVNTQEDLEYIRSIYNGVYEQNQDFRAKDIIEYLDNRRLN